MAQLSLNRLDLPRDILYLIKDFAFYDIYSAHLRKIKNMYIAQIECALTNTNLNIYSTRYSLYDYLFKVNGQFKFIYCIFCKRCGNYIESFTTSRHHKNSCKCYT